MIIKKYGVDFARLLPYKDTTWLTLYPDYVKTETSKIDWRGQTPRTKTHLNGWTITGVVQEHHDEWVNQFEASHPVYGNVWGDYQHIVYADSEEAFCDFYNNFPPKYWNEVDI